MSDLVNQLLTPELQMALLITGGVIVVLYILSIVWVIRDAYARGARWQGWALVSLVPIVGVVAYCLLRPPLYAIDRDEQQLEIAIKQRELAKYGQCAQCGYAVESDFILCPNCQTRLKNLCISCRHALQPEWSVCPYCATPVSGRRH